MANANNKSDTLVLHEWCVWAGVDDDGHLTVELRHADGSKIVEVDEDLSPTDEIYIARFTTEGIEALNKEQ